MGLIISSFLVLVLLLSVGVLPVYARTQPSDIITENQQAFQSRLSKYSPTHQQQLKDLTAQIAQINKEETDKLEQIMITQGLILDEYQRRNLTQERIDTQTKYHTPNDALTKDGIEKARYWITYAHEAVAYQAAQVYVINLTSESNAKSDVKATVAQMKAGLTTARQKVLNSQKTLEGVIK